MIEIAAMINATCTPVEIATVAAIGVTAAVIAANPREPVAKVAAVPIQSTLAETLQYFFTLYATHTF